MSSRYLNPLRLAAGLGRRADALRIQRAKAKRYANAKALLRRLPTPLMVNIGCGNEPFTGWVNLDLDPKARADIVWDITDGLPFGNGTCSFIYSEHFVEHIPVREGVRFMKECRRVLRDGGVVRIAMPSVAEPIRQYHENDWAGKPWMEKYGYTWIKTRAEFINIAFREWGHQWLYDFEELDRRLREAGFGRIESARWGESRHAELTRRETRDETLLICEATK
jgi:predicted SAM-dependent methyltransferase